MRRKSAETVALAVLAYVTGDDDLRGVFLGATGLSPDDLRARAGDPELLAATLDFVLMDDAWVTSAADATGHPPADLVAARAALPGGDAPHWT